jgi:RNA 2',3'-cyclic 3'-phosphodiesterase
MFVAIELEHAVKRSLTRIADGLGPLRKSVRWIGPDQLHVTLKFLGDVPDEDAGGIGDACAAAAAECEPFEFAIDICGCFPREGDVRIVWGGAQHLPDALSACAARCEDAFAAIGFSRESRPFKPHVTVGRVRDDRSRGRLREAVGEVRVKSTQQSVVAMTLFESVLSPQGARYNKVGRFRFGHGK